MDWGLKYIGHIQNKGLGMCHVHIHKKDYIGGADSIRIIKNGLDISIDSKDYFDPIISINITLCIVNNKTNFYELEELLTVTDLEYLITVFSDTLLLFRGYIPCAIAEQEWLKNGILTLNATCNLNRLNEYTPTIIDTIGMYTLMDLIEDCLSATQLDLPIWINCNLEEYDAEGGNTCFDQTWIDSDLFWKNIIEKRDCKDILESILRTCSCVVYYYNDRWYIERLKDIGGASNSYKVYWGNSYVETQNINNIDLILGRIKDGDDLECCNTTQIIRYNPGLRRIDVTLNQQRRWNYVNYFLDDIIKVESLSLLEFDQGIQNEWHTTNESYVTYIVDHYINKMNSHIKFTYTGFASLGIDETNPTHIDLNLRKSLMGLITRFPLQLNTTGTTSLTISFKFKLPSEFFSQYTYFASDCKIHPDNHIFFVRFYIGLPVRYYLFWDDATSTYIFRQQNDLTIYSGGHSWGLISVPIPFSNFTDKDNFYHEFSKTIELNPNMEEESSVTNDTLWTLGICLLGYNNPLYAAPGTDRFNKPNAAYHVQEYGDVVVTASDDLGNNLITGSIVKDFIDIKQVDVDLCDSANYSLLNAMYRDDGSDGKQHTTQWSDTGLPPWQTLIRCMIQDNFQLHNKVRREIVSDIHSEIFMRPFSLVDVGLPNPGTVQVTAAKTVIGTATQFQTTFEIDDIIAIEGENSNTITSIESDTELHVINDFNVVPLGPKLTYIGGVRNKFYVNGYRYNLDSDIYYNMSLKEYIDNDGVT